MTESVSFSHELIKEVNDFEKDCSKTYPDIDLLIINRSTRRRKVTMLVNRIDGNMDDIPDKECKFHLKELNNLKVKLDELDSKIQDFGASTFDRTKYKREIDLADEYSSKISNCLNDLEEVIAERIRVTASTRVNLASDEPNRLMQGEGCSRAKLPTVELPRFDGRNLEYFNEWILAIQESLSKHSISNYDKFLHLKSVTSGHAYNLLQSLPLEGNSYAEAIKILICTYSDTVSQKFSVINKLNNLKMIYSTDGMYNWIGDVGHIIKSVKMLQIAGEDFLQYYVWHSMAPAVQNQLVTITNKSKPSLSEILDNQVQAITICKERKEKFNNFESKKPFMNKNMLRESPNRVTSLATTVDRRSNMTFKPCKLCRETIPTHSLSRCDKYSTPQLKISRLKEINGCSKCSSLSHTADSCFIKLSKACETCGSSNHLWFLCNNIKGLKYDYKDAGKNNRSNKPESNSRGKETINVSSGLVWRDVMHMNSSDDVILPTFSATYVSRENEIETISALFDTGSQASFVTEEILCNLEHEILRDNLVLILNGFNIPQRIVTKEVLIKIKIGTRPINLKAICVPKIKTNVKVSGLTEIVKCFKELGYRMADETLQTDEINNLKIILGSSSMHLLPTKMRLFGNVRKPSAYWETLNGCIIMGEADRMLDNIKYLPKPKRMELIELDLNCINVSETGMGGSVNSVKDIKMMRNVLHGVTQNVSQLHESEYDSVVMAEMVNNTDISIKEDSGLTAEIIDTVNTYSDPDMLTMVNIAHCSINEIINDKGKVNYQALELATKDALRMEATKILNWEPDEEKVNYTEKNKNCYKYLRDNISRDDNGRFIAPILWKNNKHLLGRNYGLALSILRSTYNKLRNSPRLKQYDDVFKEQLKLGIIEKVANRDQFLNENVDNLSFLAHQAVYREEHTSTKIRIVFLSNLCERNRKFVTLSHNDCIEVGPNLNCKISHSINLSRFDKYIMICDIKKAYLQIGISEDDGNKLLFLWYDDVCSKGSTKFSIYRPRRLPFGLTCSPTILMSCLSLICIPPTTSGEHSVEADFLSEIFDGAYMDNLQVSGNSFEEMQSKKLRMESIFSLYGFPLQQFFSNCHDIQLKFDERTPDREDKEITNFFGLNFNYVKDSYTIKPTILSVTADTVRKVLQTFQRVYDVQGFILPILNRAKLFLQRLLVNKDITWDTILCNDLKKEWRLISKQFNKAKPIEIPRFCGERSSKYDIIAFADASSLLYATVIYIRDVRTNKVSFLLSKNRIVSKKYEKKTIPCLETIAMEFAVRSAIEIYVHFNNLNSKINVGSIYIYTDSSISLSWLYNYSYKYSNMQRKNVLVVNRLHNISKLCENGPEVVFEHTAGRLNPADMGTRVISAETLLRSNFYSGPDFLKTPDSNLSQFRVLLPNPLNESIDRVELNLISNDILEPIFPLQKYCSFFKMTRVLSQIFKFCHRLKLKVINKDPIRFNRLGLTCSSSSFSYYSLAYRHLLKVSQRLNFADVLDYFESHGKTPLKYIPPLVSQLNLFLDKYGILRVKSKLEKSNANYSAKFPILLSKSCHITQAIIIDQHKLTMHAGIYRLIQHLRQHYWIINYYSVIKRAISDCVTCLKLNGRTIGLNQNAYREFRINPGTRPFSSIGIDYIGPFIVKFNNEKLKVYLLLLTCLYTRAVNLELCTALDNHNYFRALQLHVYKHGIPEFILSDNASQIVSASRELKNFYNDYEFKEFIDHHNIQPLEHKFICAGTSYLGSTYERLVKECKHLLYKSIKKNVLTYFDFELIKNQVISMVNKRPIACSASLRDSFPKEVAITPEILIYGYELPTISTIPQATPDVDQAEHPVWTDERGKGVNFNEELKKLRSVKAILNNIYHQEFLSNLLNQATNTKNRYVPVKHDNLQVGCVVAISTPNTKRYTWPLGVVIQTYQNSKDETIEVLLQKGNGMKIRKHVSELILLINCRSQSNIAHSDQNPSQNNEPADIDKNMEHNRQTLPKRKAAIQSELRNREILSTA